MPTGTNAENSKPAGHLQIIYMADLQRRCSPTHTPPEMPELILLPVLCEVLPLHNLNLQSVQLYSLGSAVLVLREKSCKDSNLRIFNPSPEKEVTHHHTLSATRGPQ